MPEIAVSVSPPYIYKLTVLATVAERHIAVLTFIGRHPYARRSIRSTRTENTVSIYKNMHIVVTAQIPTRQNRPQNHMPYATPYHIARHNPHTTHPLAAGACPTDAAAAPKKDWRSG